jgi:hypothetical protein
LKDPYQVLRQKESDLRQKQIECEGLGKQIEALKVSIELLKDDFVQQQAPLPQAGEQEKKMWP